MRSDNRRARMLLASVVAVCVTVVNVQGADAQRTSRRTPRAETTAAAERAGGKGSWSVPRGASALAADIGNALAGTLHSDCKVALYGLHFDFNKATLRPDSEPILNQVLVILKADTSSQFKLSGHTDDVGEKAYNQKLSTARADAVKAWLVKNGAAATRLATQGFGDTAPLVANDSDANRARNRRVELSKPGCK